MTDFVYKSAINTRLKLFLWLMPDFTAGIKIQTKTNYSVPGESSKAQYAISVDCI